MSVNDEIKAQWVEQIKAAQAANRTMTEFMLSVHHEHRKVVFALWRSVKRANTDTMRGASIQLKAEACRLQSLAIELAVALGDVWPACRACSSETQSHWQFCPYCGQNLRA